MPKNIISISLFDFMSQDPRSFAGVGHRLHICAIQVIGLNASVKKIPRRLQKIVDSAHICLIEILRSNTVVDDQSHNLKRWFPNVFLWAAFSE